MAALRIIRNRLIPVPTGNADNKVAGVYRPAVDPRAYGEREPGERNSPRPHG